MYLGLSIENGVINAAAINDGADLFCKTVTTLTTTRLLIYWKFAAPSSQTRPKRTPICLNPLRLARKAALSARLGRFVAMASPGQALALYESRFSAIKDSAVAYARYLDNHVLGGVTFGPKLRRGANRIVGAWGHTPLAWP
jgi:hypothetical protein